MDTFSLTFRIISGSDEANNGRDNNEDDRSSASTPSSDTNRCPICLEIIRNRSVIDTCRHDYCFECISQWSLHNNWCPVCRQIYNNITFNIVSDEVFEQIEVNELIKGRQQSRREEWQQQRVQRLQLDRQHTIARSRHNKTVQTRQKMERLNLQIQHRRQREALQRQRQQLLRTQKRERDQQRRQRE